MSSHRNGLRLIVPTLLFSFLILSAATAVSKATAGPPVVPGLGIISSPLLVAGAPGDLDTTFGFGGKSIIQHAGSDEDICGMVLQPDGKIVIAGFSSVTTLDPEAGYYTDGSLYVTRLNADGSLDTGFGWNYTGIGYRSGSHYDYGFCGGRRSSGCSLVRQQDGKFLVAGVDEFHGWKSDCAGVPAVARLLPTGKPDATFGSNGLVQWMLDEIWSGTEWSHHIGQLAIQSNGKILVPISAQAAPISPDRGAWLWRLNSDGSNDTTFAQNPIGSQMGDPSTIFKAVAVQVDGKIVAVGEQNDQVLLARYRTDGNFDTAFGINGIQTVDLTAAPDTVAAMAIQSDGKILTAGQPTLARFLSNGARDPNFGPQGGFVSSFSAEDLDLAADGKIVVVGGFNNDFAVARYNSDGRPDTGFGHAGLTTTDLGGAYEGAGETAILPDGRILVGGATCPPGGDCDVALARYLAVSPAVMRGPRAGIRPVIDGNLSEWQGLGGTYVDHTNASYIWGEIPSVDDLSVRLRTSWAPEGVYFAAAIRDNVLVGGNSADVWGDDIIELSVYTGGAVRQYSLCVDGRKTRNGNPISTLTVVTSTTPGGWAVEALIPVSELGLTNLAAEQQIPFTFALWDDDLYAKYGQTHMFWQSDSATQYKSTWGVLQLGATSYDFIPAEPTATSTATPTATSTATPTATSTATRSSTPTVTSTPTLAVQATATLTATPTATSTGLMSTSTPTPTPTATTVASRGTIHGEVWFDWNGDGLPGDGEPGLVGITVQLYRGAALIGVTSSGGDGSYAFAGLPPDSYRLREINPPWLRLSTTPDEVTEGLAAGEVVKVGFGDWNGRGTYLPLLLR